MVTEKLPCCLARSLLNIASQLLNALQRTLLIIFCLSVL